VGPGGGSVGSAGDVTQRGLAVLAPTAYPEVNALLSGRLAGARTILGPHFVGMILFGSLAGGDFDAASDVDVLVITDDDVSGEMFAALDAMHQRIALGASPWAVQLEVSYIPQAALRRHDPNHATHPHLDRGPGERLKWMAHDAAWLVQRQVLRERGLVLAGPAPKSLIDPISPNDLRAAMRQVLQTWATPMLADPLGVGCTRLSIVYRALTLPYSLPSGARHGCFQSRRRALGAGDARQTLDRPDRTSRDRAACGGRDTVR
jgi:hypothetical protein